MSVATTIEKWIRRFVKNYGGQDFSNEEMTFSDNGPNMFDKFTNGLDNLWKGVTGSGLTQRDLDLNKLNMQNVEDTASAQVAGFNKAGVNPALMFSGGASNSAPSASAVPTTGSMSELMQALSLPLQMKMIKAQIANVNAQTDKTKVDTGKSSAETDEIRARIGETKARVKGLDISNEQQSIILSYLDRMQSAELAIKTVSKERMEVDIKQIYQSIDNMSAEELATYVSMCETVEKINSLQSQQKLNDEQGRYYAKLVDNLDKQGKILDLQERDWDYINVVGTTSFSTGVGPFKGSESRPVTLHDLKAHAEKVGEEKSNQYKNRGKTWQELKEDASKKYGVLE